MYIIRERLPSSRRYLHTHELFYEASYVEWTSV